VPLSPSFISTSPALAARQAEMRATSHSSASENFSKNGSLRSDSNCPSPRTAAGRWRMRRRRQSRRGKPARGQARTLPSSRSACSRSFAMARRTIAVQRLRDAGAERRGRRRLDIGDLVDQAEVVGGLERQSARQQVVHHHAHRVDVGAMVERVFLQPAAATCRRASRSPRSAWTRRWRSAQRRNR